MTKRRGKWADRRLFFLILLWIACAAVYGLGCRSQAQALRQLQASLEPLNKQVEGYGSVIVQMQDLQGKIAELEEKRKNLARQRVGPEMTARLIQQIAQLAQESQVVIEGLEPLERTSAPGALPAGVEKVSFQVRLRSGYEAFGEFLGRLDSLSAVFTVDRMTLRARSSNPPEGTLQIDLLMGAYGLT